VIRPANFEPDEELMIAGIKFGHAFTTATDLSDTRADQLFVGTRLQAFDKIKSCAARPSMTKERGTLHRTKVQLSAPWPLSTSMRFACRRGSALVKRTPDDRTS
jgi:hypothetical protein